MLPKKLRLTKRGSFAYVYKAGQSVSTPRIKAYFAKSASLKIGFSVSNKIGKACERNKIKRQMRASVRDNRGNITKSCQIVFAARDAIKGATYDDISRDIAGLIDKINSKKA